MKIKSNFEGEICISWVSRWHGYIPKSCCSIIQSLCLQQHQMCWSQEHHFIFPNTGRETLGVPLTIHPRNSRHLLRQEALLNKTHLRPLSPTTSSIRDFHKQYVRRMINHVTEDICLPYDITLLDIVRTWKRRSWHGINLQRSLY